MGERVCETKSLAYVVRLHETIKHKIDQRRSAGCVIVHVARVQCLVLGMIHNGR